MLLRAQTALLAALIAAATVLPASAQGFDPAEVKQRAAAKWGGKLPNIGRPYSIRVTTGASSNAGFEKALTNSDPNLKHWCWVPVTNYNQGFIHVGAGEQVRGKKYERPQSVYAKPKHVALPVINHGHNQIVIGRSNGGSRSSSSVNATVSFAKNPAPRAYTGETNVATYGDVSGRLMAPRYTAAALNESRSVYGKLVTH